MDQNLVGEGGARELAQGMEMRKELGLPVAKVVVTVHISNESFQKIVELGSTKKKKRKKTGKKVTIILKVFYNCCHFTFFFHSEEKMKAPSPPPPTAQC